ncbi:hypothetical protein ACP4OV_027585 [Aristida adscensionis]
MAAAYADAGGATAAVRLRVAWRFVRAAEVVVLAVLLSRYIPGLPCAAGAASSLRAGASFLLHPVSIIVLVTVIVVVLVGQYRRDVSTTTSAAAAAAASKSPSPSPFSGHAAQDGFLYFPPPTLMLPPITEVPEPPKVQDEVFQDKKAVHVTVRAQPPRRSRSEKQPAAAAAAVAAAAAGGATRRAASPELRRAESENGRRRRSTSAAAPADWGTKDKDEFRRTVEAFIEKQQKRFHREQSLVAAAGDDSPAATTGAVVTVK